MPRLSAPLLALVGAAVCAALVGGGQTARADFFSSTTAGPLTQAHADLDNKDKCEKCHAEPRKVTREKCVACHAVIADRQREGKGVHANPKALGKPCEVCHNEHKGRGKDILGWSTFGGKDHFDHDTLTTFALEGKHKDLACAKCHTQKTSTGYLTYLKSPIACVGCHANPHGDTREPMKKCERCHDARSWKMLEHAQFNHDKDSRYPLEKKHESAKCTQCHAKTAGNRPPSAKANGSIPTGTDGLPKLIFRYPTWAFDCTPCHENVHGTSLFGTKACKLCHSAKVDWPKVNFDHNKRTKFPLEGAHEHKATCESCHKKDEKHAPERACVACHVDKHNGRFAEYKAAGTNGQADCNVCHTANVWKPENKFDHRKNTRFPLTDAHAGADCRMCHRGKGPTEWEHLENLIQKVPNSKVLTVACMGCHQHENVHQKQYKNEDCLGCHVPGRIQISHIKANPLVNDAHGPNSKFPLTEGHKGVDCTKCHPGNNFLNFKDKNVECGPTCHPDELHKGSLGDHCTKCHKGGKWEARLFDHDKDTNWPLVGNHKDVLCDSCHPRRDFAANRGKSRTCYNCHKKDDAHAGELGTHCENCHIPDGSVTFEHNDPKVSDWPLNGKHYSVECNKCHTSIHFRPTPRECNGCHGEPTVHKGQLGTLCSRCHEESGWKTIHTRHDVPGIRFAGAHDRVSCYKCHTLGRLLEGTGPLCITCHRNDDIHNNGLGPRCGECHSQNTWAGAKFDHNTVGCNLMGVHRLVPCQYCHTGGNFVAVSPTCVSCHRKDAIRGATFKPPAGPPPPVNHASEQTCAGCHNPNYFYPESPARTGARESVCQ